MICAHKIEQFLNTDYLCKSIIVFDEIDSTNTYLKNDIELPIGTLAVANYQTSGRGRLGKSFYSPKDRGAYFSLLISPDILPDFTSITPVAAVAVCNAIDNLYGITTQIKWVNDIVFEDKKLCGILTESSKGRIVLGIGINLEGVFEGELADNAISLSSITRKSVDKNLLIASVINQLEARFSKDNLWEYKKRLSLLNKEVKIVGKDDIYKAIDVDDNFRLVVSDNNHNIIKLNSGEVSIIKVR